MQFNGVDHNRQSHFEKKTYKRLMIIKNAL